MTLNKWVLLCCILALPCVGAANLLIYMGGRNQGSPGDSDSDGLPDAWEQEHFGDLNYSGDNDPDTDGVINTDELARGTDPNDSSSFAVTLYVDADTGDDTYDGLARTWDGAHGPKPTINTALAVILPGDTVHVLPGTYPENVNISTLNVTLTGEGTLKGTP